MTRVMRKGRWVDVVDEPANYRLDGKTAGGRIAIEQYFGADPAGASIYRPGEDQAIAASGAWVVIVRQLPAIEGNIDEHIRVGRIFWVEREPGSDANGFTQSGTFKVRCRSPWGELCLWPYEYSIIDREKILALWQSGEMIFHPTNIDLARLNDVTFYARSRGIPLGVAAVMALGTLDGPVGWFEPRPDLAGAAEELSATLSRRLYETRRVGPPDLPKARKRKTKKAMTVSIVVDGEPFSEVQIP